MNSFIRTCLLLSLFFPVLLNAATQTINLNAPNILEIAVQDNATPAIWVQQPNGRVYQYYGESDWGSVIWLNGTDATARYTTGYAGSIEVTPVSNVLTGSGTSGDPWTITTVVDLGATGVQMTQTITYADGDRTIGKKFTLTNTSGSTFNDVRFFHGGDTYFGGSDSARSWWDEANSMIYVNNNDFTNQGIMGFYANPATPASHHFGGHFAMGNTQAVTTGRLDDTADSNYLDAGYYLEWDRASLAPAQSWTILSYETWSEPTFLQVIAPASDYVQANTTVTRIFKVHNLSGNVITTTLTTGATPSGWGVSLPNGATINNQAYEVVDVPVEITIPSGANPGDIENITLSATSGATTGSSATKLTIINLNLSITPNSAVFGTVNVGDSANRTVTFTNNTGSDVTLGSVNTSSTGYSIATDNASGQTITNGGSRTIVLTLNAASTGSYPGTISWPMTAPIVANLTSSATGTGIGAPASTPEPQPQPEPEPTPQPQYEEFTRMVNSNTLNLLSIELDPNNILDGAITVEMISGSLPNGLSINGTVLNGTISSTGTYQFTISLKSGINEVRNIFTIEVRVPTLTPNIYGLSVNGTYHQLTMTSAPTHGDAAINDLFNMTIRVGENISMYAVWDYSKNPCSFRIVGGDLPPGLELIDTIVDGIPTGMIQGIPTQPGEYCFVLSIKDWRGRGYQWIRMVIE